MIQLSVFDAVVETVDNFSWLQPLQEEIDEVQEQIDVSAIASESFPKKSVEYKALQKHANAEVNRRGKMMGRHQDICAAHGYTLHPCAEVSDDCDRLRYVYRLQKKVFL